MWDGCPTTRSRVLIGCPDSRERSRLAALAQLLNCEVFECRTAEEVRRGWEIDKPDILCLDSDLEDVSAISLFAHFRSRGPLPFAVVLVPPLAIMEAVEAIRAGAREVLERPFGDRRFLNTLKSALASLGLYQRGT